MFAGETEATLKTSRSKYFQAKRPKKREEGVREGGQISLVTSSQILHTVIYEAGHCLVTHQSNFI